MLQFIKLYPFQCILVALFVCGAMGDLGRIVKSRVAAGELSPRFGALAALLQTLSSIGVSFLGVAGALAKASGKTVPEGVSLPAPPAVPTIPAPDERGSGNAGFVAILAGVGVGLVAAYAIVGCGPTKAAAAYGVQLEACLQTSRTCAEYIECRDRVQVGEGRGHYQATCEPADSGPDALAVDPRADALEAGIAEGGAK